MSWYHILNIFVVMLGAFTLAYQIFRMTELDARSRGLKHPKFGGFFALSGKGSGGIILYLLGRRKYPSSMSTADKLEMNSHKKKAGVSLIFLTVSTIVLFIICILTL